MTRFLPAPPEVRWFARWSVLVLLVACGDSTSPAGPAAAAAVTITPVAAPLIVGDTLRLRAAARDAQGRTIDNPSVTWSSSDQNVASVSTTGLVTGRARGAARIRAAVDAVHDSLELTISFRDFAPARDTSISGTISVERLSIPAGVTVTATAGVVIRAIATVDLTGTLRGDCVPISVEAGLTLAVSGTLRNECSANPPATPPTTRVIGTGAMNVTGTIASAGDVLITNDPTLFATGASGVLLRAALSQQAPADCHYVGRVSRGPGRRGADGSPEGEQGGQGGRVLLGCSGEMTLGGTINAGNGGDGGNGTSEGAFEAVGGPGGRGGDVEINTPVGILTATGNTPEVFIGRCGKGGDATAVSVLSARAEAGTGGNGGIPQIDIGRHLIGPMLLYLAGGGAGGSASAKGLNGASATETTPAEPSGSAFAEGGSSGQLGDPPARPLFGTYIKGPADVLDFSLLTVEGFTPRAGGNAHAQTGVGGDGSYQYPDGAAAGSLSATGGGGSSAYILHPQTGLSIQLPGAGGKAIFGAAAPGPGGVGARRCSPTVRIGGRGGRGSDTSGSDGRPGVAHGYMAQPGGVELNNVGSAGAGNDGVPFGTGGAAGGRLYIPFGVVRETGGNFQRGTDGRLCPGLALKLDFQTGPYPAGTLISISRITGAQYTQESACPDLHVHGAITIDGAGPFPDPRNGAGCGHGIVVSQGG